MADRVGQQLGNYRLLRKIGQGAFAEVYLAEHQYLERLAAIKVLHVQIELKTQEQFRREARTIAHLQHPHIVQVLEFGLDDQTPYLVMEYTPGGTLRSQHSTGTRLPFEQIVTYVKQIASALDYAHQQRVIHRDVKPDNLLLNANHEVVLSDFGLAVVQSTLDSLSLSNPAAGTPLYMAPEQIQRQPCAASDQYALGIMVYEWLAGEAPFRGSLFEVFSHHLHQPPPSLCEHLPGLPFAVEETVFKALAKDPAHRFASVTDFALAFEEACDVTQTLTLRWLPKQSLQEPVGSSSTQLVPPSNAQEHEGSSSLTQSILVTVPPKEQMKEALPLSAISPVMPRQPHSIQVKPSLAQSNRQRFLRRVRAYWIEGVLEHSLHGAALIALGLREQLDALANPWHLVLQHPDSAPRSFPLGTRIHEVYDAANGELLILGAPGSGKTTLLLALARDLLDCAEQDEQQHLPVVFPLSSWSAKQLRLTEWMVEELIDKYDVPRKLARAWVDDNQLLPLLDGLDEVVPEKRSACIEAINTYHQEHAFLPLVVTSRSADYLAQTERVRLTSAVTVQSLTQQQVDDYLTHGGESLWALRVALHQDVSLRELTETPLMLSILTLTYHDMPIEALLRGGIAPTRQQVFEQYVQRMLHRRGVETRYKPQQTMRWLSWLAKQLIQHNQTEFHLERMQPAWVSKNRRQRMLSALIAALVSVLLFGLSSVLLFGLAGLLFGSQQRITTVVYGSIQAWACDNSTCDPPSTLSPPVVSSSVLQGAYGTVQGGLTFALLFGLLTVLIGGVISIRKRSIQPIEVVKWHWTGRWRRLLLGLLVGLSLGLLIRELLGLLSLLIFVLLDMQSSSQSFGQTIAGFSRQYIIGELLFGLKDSLLFGGMGLLLGGAMSRTSSELMDKHIRSTPNEGIRRSARYAVISGLSVMLVGGVSVGLTIGSFDGLFFGLVVGIITGLLNGGIACIQHLLLRVRLWYERVIPWHYARFLDFAAERILLRKVGGGYIFVHRLLLEYFASLDTTPTLDAARAKKEKTQLASCTTL